MISSISKSVIYTVDFRGVKLAGTKEDLLSLQSEILSTVGNGGNLVESKILSVVCDHFGIRLKSLLSGPRSSYISEVRFMTYRLLMDEVDSTRRVSELMPRRGKPRDYGTILSGLARHDWLMKTSERYREEFCKLKQRVKQRVKQ